MRSDREERRQDARQRLELVQECLHWHRPQVLVRGQPSGQDGDPTNFIQGDNINNKYELQVDHKKVFAKINLL